MTAKNKMRFTLRLPSELYKKLDAEAKEKGKSKNVVILDACWEFVNKCKKQSE